MSRKLQLKPSSNIDQAHYDESSKTLTIHFKSGGIYAYDKIDSSAISALENAPSAGKHITTLIVGKYPVRKLQ